MYMCSLQSCTVGKCVKREYKMETIKKAIDRKVEAYRDQGSKHEKASCSLHGNVDDEYRFDHKYRGIAVVISNSSFRPSYLPSRDYAKKEIEMMTLAFSNLGFLVLAFFNLDVITMKSILTYISSLENIHRESDAFAFSIGTHGEEILDRKTQMYKHVIYGTDMHIYTEDLLKIFNDRNCKSLKGKPRLFFLQACRGKVDGESSKYDQGTEVSVRTVQPVINPKNRNSAPIEQQWDVTESEINSSSDITGYDDTKLLESTEVTEEFIEKKKKCLDQAEGFLPALSLWIPKIKRRQGIYRDDELEKKDVFERESEQIHLESSLIPCPNHFLVLYATAPGKLAFGRKEEGGWMLKAVADCFKRVLGNNEIDLLNIITQSTNYVALYRTTKTTDPKTTNLKSCICLEHRLTKNVLFR